MLVPLDPIFNGASDEHLLLLRQSVRSYAAVESHTSGRPEGGCKVLTIAVYVTKIEIQHAVSALRWRRRWRIVVLLVAKMIRAASLHTHKDFNLSISLCCIKYKYKYSLHL